MLITHYNVNNTFLTKSSFININKKINFIKSILKKYCQQTKLKFSLTYERKYNIIIGKFELSTSSAYEYGLYYALSFIIRMNSNYILINNNLNDSKPMINKLLMYILLDTESGDFIIKDFRVKPNSSSSDIINYNIIGKERKELLENFHLKNVINTFKEICKEGFLTKKEMTTRKIDEIPLFKVSNINSRGQQVFTYMDSVKARRKLNSHELSINNTPRKIKKMSSSSKKNRFKVKSLDQDKLRHVLESKKRTFLQRTNKSLKIRGRETIRERNILKEKELEMDEGDVNIGVLIITMHGGIPYKQQRLGNFYSLFSIQENKFPNVYYRSSTKIGLYSIASNPSHYSPDVSPNNDSDDEYEYLNSSNLSKITTLQAIQSSSLRFSHKNKRNIYEKCFKQTHNKLKFYKYFFNCGLNFLGKYNKAMANYSEDDGTKIITVYDEKNDKKRFLEDIIDNGKVDYLINKTYSVEYNKLDGTRDNIHKVTFIFYNTSTKRYQKYNLIDEDDFNNYCQDFGINTTTRIILKYMSDIKNTNSFKTIILMQIMYILSFLNLKYLYIYDDSCSSYDIDPELIKYYTEIAEPRMTISEIDKEITREIYDIVNQKMEQENKKVGI
jgi:hypothetical protein